jgi:hypothetical protein
VITHPLLSIPKPDVLLAASLNFCVTRLLLFRGLEHLNYFGPEEILKLLNLRCLVICLGLRIGQTQVLYLHVPLRHTKMQHSSMSGAGFEPRVSYRAHTSPLGHWLVTHSLILRPVIGGRFTVFVTYASAQQTVRRHVPKAIIFMMKPWGGRHLIWWDS